MLSNEVFALQCRAWYEEQGLIVDETNGEFAHSPLTRKECGTGYYLLHGHHQHQGLLQSRDLGKCCFFKGHTRKWLVECDYFPKDYFELWDIYEEFSGQPTRDHNKKLHEEKNDEGKSLHNLKIHSEKDEMGRSKVAMKTIKIIHAEKNHDGKSEHAVKMASQVWKSTVDGFESNAAGVSHHNRSRGWDPKARIRVK